MAADFGVLLLLPHQLSLPLRSVDTIMTLSKAASTLLTPKSSGLCKLSHISDEVVLTTSGGKRLLVRPTSFLSLYMPISATNRLGLSHHLDYADDRCVLPNTFGPADQPLNWHLWGSVLASAASSRNFLFFHWPTCFGFLPSTKVWRSICSLGATNSTVPDMSRTESVA